jgi:hypothetical protein
LDSTRRIWRYNRFGNNLICYKSVKQAYQIYHRSDRDVLSILLLSSASYSFTNQDDNLIQSRIHRFSGWSNTWITGVVDRCPLKHIIISVLHIYKKVKCAPSQSTIAFPNTFVVTHTSFIANANMYCSRAKFFCSGDH